MTELAIIGGTGLTTLKNLDIIKREVVHTPFGEPSGPLTHGVLSGKEVVFLARHGYGHTIPPHRINYRANLWALHHTGVKNVIAVAAVGGISDDLDPGTLAIPDQIIDYTAARDNTFFEDGLSHVTHVDFTEPYSAELRDLLIRACRAAKVEFVDHGTYGTTQGPRLETAAEIDRMARDGCSVVGMTGMPEAALARELASTCEHDDFMWHEIELSVKQGMDKVREVLEQVVPLLGT